MTQSRGLRGISTLLVLFTMGAPVEGHPFHESLAEAYWNPEIRKLEVVVRIHPEDLETAVRRQKGQSIQLEDREAEAEVERYLRRTFRIRSRDQRPVEFEWVGLEINVRSAWVYFEVPLVGRLEGTVIINELLNHVPHQTNTVSIRDRERQASLKFTSANRFRGQTVKFGSTETH